MCVTFMHQRDGKAWLRVLYGKVNITLLLNYLIVLILYLEYIMIYTYIDFNIFAVIYIIKHQKNIYYDPMQVFPSLSIFMKITEKYSLLDFTQYIVY